MNLNFKRKFTIQVIYLLINNIQEVIFVSSPMLLKAT